MADTGVKSAIIGAAERHAHVVLELTQRVCEIPAPTFSEQRRAAFVREHFATLGLENWVDEVGNAYARRPGSGKGIILLAAHTDTVFPIDTDLTVRHEGDRLIGPGIGDNSLSVAALLTLPRILDEASLTTGPDLLLCSDVGEEGLGNLRGIRQAVATYRDELTSVIAVEGHELGRVVNRAVGSKRFRITVEGPGGHSWGAFGNASAIHALGEIITAIAHLPVPTEPKTTFNVGLIEGGASVNTIAPFAALTLDLRSVDPVALADLVSRVEAIVREANNAERGITVQSEAVGDRPAGAIPEDALIVRTALDIDRELGIEAHLDAGSTDANIPIASGIPSVCIGLTTGGHAHCVDEYINIPPVATGLKQLALLVARMSKNV